MGCSSPDFLLDPLDTPKQIKTKLGRSFCEPQNLNGNVAMVMAKQLIFPLLSGASAYFLFIYRKSHFGALAIRIR
ncbi:hypothetical protein ANCCAN_29307 [Ancylostoma caninum]|uniref:Uncharacterized protein n=1 Tax=Ancylostoma caninum TaxID=29170 RepID=A0A368EYT4_ANCCA|nr:hypothetical protein ANCCAN_29307 [Ancylostoma caninum]